MEIQIVSGFLGAGKTTFLNQYLSILKGKTVVIENEFGDVGLDGSLIQGDIPVREIYAGCICCSLAMDFQKGIKEIYETFKPDRIVIEPSGVGRLSDIIKACNRAKEKENIDIQVTKLVAIVDFDSFEEYEEGFGAFYMNQIQHARLLLFSNTALVSKERKRMIISRLQAENPKAILYEGDFRQLDSEILKKLVDMSEDYASNPEEVFLPALPANRVFSSVSICNSMKMSESELNVLLKELKKEKYGYILRAKGIIKTWEHRMLHFNYTPSSSSYHEVNMLSEINSETKIIIIGCELNDRELHTLFQN
ncbi:MAG: GTP-binding protein [Lachnospiraceae bacterium]